MENSALVMAVLAIGITMIGVVISMMFWVRNDANSLRDEARGDRKDMLNMVRAIELEMKDFHNRLFDLERNRK